MTPRNTNGETRRGVLLVDREIAACLGTQVRPALGASPISVAQIQPASLDLRLGPRAWRIAAGFLPGGRSVDERLEELALEEISLEGAGAVLRQGSVYLVALDEELALDGETHARFNPRSSTGRCDVFTRVLCASHPRFDEAPPGYRGALWLEIAPLSFDVRVARGDRMCQMRLAHGDSALTTAELVALYMQAPLCSENGRALSTREVVFDREGGLCLRVGLAGRDPVAWRARAGAPVLEFGRERAHDAAEFFEPVPATASGVVLEPGHFYVFASREKIRVPPDHAAEMLPVDLGLGELRNNYAGFFDSGFGWSDEPASERASFGTSAVLEVRAHDVPFLVEDGQAFARLRYFRTSGRPDRTYGEGRASYRDQDLTLARVFRPAP